MFIEEKIDGVVVASYEITALSEIKQAVGRDIYVDGEIFISDDWSDFEMQFDKLLKAFAFVVLDEINILRNKASLAERTVAQLKTAVKNKYDTI